MVHKKDVLYIGQYAIRDARQKGREKCKNFKCQRMERVKGYCSYCYTRKLMLEQTVK